MQELERQVRTIAVPSVGSSVAAARRLVDETLAAAGVDADTLDTAVLLTSEVVTNAVLHARTEVVVSVAVDAAVVVVEVSDGSPALPRPRRHDADSITGRGLDLVEMLATAYGTRPDAGGGKTVWFSLGGTPAVPEPGWATAGDELVTVGTLRAVPVGLYRVLQEQNEALLREYELVRLDSPDRPEPRDGDGYGHAAGEGAGTSDEVDGELLGAAARARTHLATLLLDAMEGLPDTGHVDVAVTAEPAEVPGFRVLLRVLEAAERLASAGVLLTRPALPELQALRAWLLDDLVAQLDGAAPTPWSPPAEDVLPDPLLPALDLDTAWVADEPRGVVLADDANRILAASPAAAALLGWTPDELRGQRLTVLVPEGLREAHLTGFTRHLVTGRDRIIGQQVVLEARRRDGTQVPVRLLLESGRAGARTYYLGWLDPLDS